MNHEHQNALLGYYESISQASQAMLQAARRSDWDALVDAEQRCAGLIKHVQAMGDSNAILDPDGRKRKHAVILKVLAADAEIRTLTQPWLRQLERWLGNNRTSRLLEATYRT